MNKFTSPIRLINKKIFFISAISLWLLPGMPPHAEQNLPQQNTEQEHWISRQPTFSELDKDQDSYLGKAEAKSWQTLNDKFDQVDKNSDQKIDRSEFSAFETHLIEESIQEFTSPQE
ncbi:hypothetical protein [Nitrosococcus wardiae]|uniref:EF-hand domain-containing protein n=1 Tax=Nitrosococcus wardiae TaxID=1814290 RepID=A0A4P7BYL3_9GAMM|nr:hypothetical protein [Nitrosococcus wardiae]QBQ55278.1 hypothetical protein E3U44_12725 [Nitrosococcus wardiae]